MEEKITAQKIRIAELIQLADEAYRRRDYAAENRHDAERKRLEKLLDDAQPEEHLTEADLIPHDWNPTEIAIYGNTRCRVCSMQYRYFQEGMKNLNQWPESEKRTRQFNENMKRYSCSKR